MSSVLRVVHLGQAFVAGRAVDTDGHVRHSAGGAFDDTEAVEGPVTGQRGPVDRGDPGKRRGSFAEQPTELGHLGLLTFDLDEHTGGVVQYEADEPERHGVAEHERTKAHALHCPGDSHAPALRELTQLVHQR